MCYGTRKLLVEPEIHSQLVHFNIISALIALLKRGVDNHNHLQSSQYAAFSLSNLATNKDHRKQIVEEEAIEPLIILACTDDLNVQRHALLVLRGICISPIYRITLIEFGILDPLVLMARSDEIDFVRGVSAALNCLSSMDENRKKEY